jgi:hypothetical protein
MNTPFCRRATIALALFGSLPFGVTLAQDGAAAPAGELWRTTSQTSMEGAPMKMPPQTHEICASSDWTTPPAAASEEMTCTSSNPQHDGLKTTWTSVCTGRMEMTGGGEITFEDGTRSAYSGEIRYATDYGSVIISLAGQRLGTCDNPM